METKTCTKCEIAKSLDEFYSNKNGPLGRTWYCKECISTKAKEKYKKDPQKSKSRAKKNYSNNKEKVIKRITEWGKNNPDRVREYKKRYKLKRSGLLLEKDHTPNYQDILVRDGYFCYLCEERVLIGDHNYDHIVPVIKDGYHADWNISITHSSCNRSKNATDPKDLPEPQRSRALKKLDELSKLYKIN